MSQSPKRAPSGGSSSPKGKQNEDEKLLDERLRAFEIETPTNILLLVGLVTSFLPAYLAHAVYYLSWTYVFHLPMFLVVCGGTAFLLSHAYKQMTHSNYQKKTKHFEELKNQSDNTLLKSLRLQEAMAQAMFNTNLLFVVLCTLLQVYIFRQQNPYMSYILSPLLAGAVAWILAEKSLELRKRK
jgi:hypothetical protein